MVEKALSAVLTVLLCSAVLAQTTNQDNQLDFQGAVLSRYEKTSTQQNGGGLEPVVSYYFVNGSETNVLLSMRNSSLLNSPIDYTIMFWFKLAEFTAEKGLPMNLFSIKDFLSCSIDETFTFICKGGGVETIQVATELQVLNKWIHIAISISATNQDSYLILSDNFGILDSISSKNLWVQQTSTEIDDWSICFGQCLDSEKGFVGGIREVVARNSFTDEQKALLDQNKILAYSADIKAYYRILKDPLRFDQDQFQIKRKNKKQSQNKNYMAFENVYVDIIPPNVCPQNFNYQEFYRFSFQQQLEVLKIDFQMPQENYAYSMQLGIYINQTSCQTTNIQKAINGCNLVHLEGVFILYFEQQNQLRFHFFARESYFETQSSRIFVPYNTWISIQMTMGQASGYAIYVLDSNYNTITSLVQQFNMRFQAPIQKLHLFSSLIGYVNDFVLSNVQQILPITVIQLKNPTIKLNFKAQISQQTQELLREIKNQGTSTRTAQLKFEPQSDQVLFTPFKIVSKKIQAANFDGLSCNDGHLAVLLTDSNSYISFSLPPIQMNANFTVQFWFKLLDESQYTQSSMIFSVYDSVKDLTYWQVFIGQNGLQIAPFGRVSQNSPFLYFSLFSKENEDEFGWWFLSCAYQYQATIECHLQNSDPEVDYVQTVNIMSNKPLFKNQELLGFIGYNEHGILGASSLAVKEFRIWEKFISDDEVRLGKHYQVTQEQIGGLLVYFKMNSAKRPLTNLVSPQSSSDLLFISGSFSGLADFSDFILKNELQFSKETNSLTNATFQSFHPVCPQYTYLMGNRCYNNPINELILSIFPQWNDESSSLDWIFTLEHSSVINSDALILLSSSVFSDDFILDSLFQQQLESGNTLTFTINQQNLRNENEYWLSPYFQNGLKTVYEQQQVQFIPNKCQWFEIEGFNSSIGSQTFNNPPGQDDLTFNLVLQKNSDPSCQFQSFYDAFSYISFNFVQTDTDEKIEVQPVVQYTLISGDSNCSQTSDGPLLNQNNCSDEFTVQTIGDFKIQVVVAADQLVYMPINKEVKILMAVGWTSSSFRDVLVQQIQDLPVFQNSIYTISFQPEDEVSIQINLDSNIQNITRGQTLNLDASNVTTQNYPQQLAEQNVFYLWSCPSELSELCSDQSVLNITWSQIKKIQNIRFNKQYSFSVTAALVRNNEILTLNSTTIKVIWFDTVIPEFDIEIEPNPILVTAGAITQFSISPINFNSQDQNQFTIEWNTTKSIQDSLNFENGADILQIPPNIVQFNTTYFVSATLTYYYADWITNTVEVNFTTSQGSPYGGITIISPENGNLGDNYTVQIADWISYQTDDAIFFYVYETQDSLGKVQGTRLNDDPLTANETFTWQINSTYPIQVVILDQIGEQTIIIVLPNVTNTPSLEVLSQNQTNSSETSTENNDSSSQVNSSTEDESNQTVDSTNTTDSSSNLADTNDTVEQQTEPTNATTEVQTQPNENSNQINNTEVSQTETKDNSNLDANVNSSDANDQQNSEDNFSFSTTTNPQSNQNQQFEDQSAGDQFTKIFPNSQHNVSSLANKFAKVQNKSGYQKIITPLESYQLANLKRKSESSPKAINQNVEKPQNLQNTQQIKLVLPDQPSFDTNIKNQSLVQNQCQGMFTNTLEKIQSIQVCNVNQTRQIQSDILKFFSTLNCSLDNTLILNQNLAAVLQRCGQDMHSALVILDHLANIAIEQKNKSAAQLVLNHLRSINYSESFSGENIGISSYKIQLDNLISNQNVTLRALNTDYQPNPRIFNDLIGLGMTSKYMYLQLIAVKSSPSTQIAVVQVYEPQSQSYVTFKQLSGQVIINFDIVPQFYKSNITVCNAYSGITNDATIQNCQTDLLIEKQQIQCTCNVMIADDTITLFDDVSRLPGELMTFPEQKSVRGQILSENNRISYFYVIIIVLIFSYGLVGTWITFRLDKSNKNKIGFEAIRSPKELFLIQKISKKLQEPISLVELRSQNFKAYQFAQLPITLFILSAIHPYISPFASLQIELTRVFRFCSYYIQVNATFIAALVHFGQYYRSQDQRIDIILDQTDLTEIGRFIAIGSVALLPIFSETVGYFCKQKIEISLDQRMIVKNEILRNLVIIVLSVTLNIGTLLFALITTRNLPLSNQYIIACSMFGLIITAGLGTNMIRVLVNSFSLAKPINLLQSSKAKQILRDFELVNQLTCAKENEPVSGFDTARSKQELCTEEGIRQADKTIEISAQIDLGFELSLKSNFEKVNI